MILAICLLMLFSGFCGWMIGAHNAYDQGYEDGWLYGCNVPYMTMEEFAEQAEGSPYGLGAK